MVIEKILKVNSTDPKVEELRKRLAAIQQKQAPVAPPGPTVQAAPTPAAPPAQPPVSAAQAKSDDIAKLAQLSFEEQKRLVERQQPELRVKEERTLTLIMGQIKEIINLNNEAAKRIKELETKNGELQKQQEIMKEKNEEMLQKMNSIDSRLEKFMGLYELITNQYNPFADQSAVLRPAAAKPEAKPAAPAGPKTQFTVSDNITKQASTVEIENKDLEESVHRFKHVEQLLADLQKKQEKEAAPTNTPPPTVGNELHGWLLSFEERLQKKLDASLQDKLHTGFAHLEQGLQSEIRDALRREVEALQQDDAQVQQTMAELQELLQAYEGTNRPAVEDELGVMTSELEKVRDEVKAIHPSLYFRVADGTVLRDIHELADALPKMSDDTFFRHVGHGRHDFADWVEQALGLPQHASALRQAATRQQMIQMFRSVR